jgi:hypothetical protein
MSFSCAINIKYFIISLAIAILCLALAGINNIRR